MCGAKDVSEASTTDLFLKLILLSDVTLVGLNKQLSLNKQVELLRLLWGRQMGR